MILDNNFEMAAQELEALTMEGFFGDGMKTLTLLRNHLDKYDYLYTCFVDWANDSNQYGQENTAHLMFVLLQLYVDACKSDVKTTLDVIANIFLGSSKYPHLECTSAFVEWLRIHTELKNMIPIYRGNPNATLGQKKKLASAVTHSYHKGVEFISKVMPSLISLVGVVNSTQLDISALSELTLHQKTKKFLELSNGKYDVLIANLDRDTRNAEAHLNLFYNANESIYILRSSSSKGEKGNTRKIAPEKMLFQIYPFIGWFAQALIYSCIILVFAQEDKERFTSSMKIVKKIAARQPVKRQ